MTRTFMSLADAVTTFFPKGGVTVRTLRRERDRGYLRTYLVGNKEFTTYDDIMHMVERCAQMRKGRGSITEKAADGLYGTDVNSVALGALKLSVQKLKRSSLNTSA